MIDGTEIFEIQKKVQDQLGGLFGPSRRQVTLFAVALDAAVLFGMLLQMKKPESQSVVEGEFWIKFKRIMEDK